MTASELKAIVDPIVSALSKQIGDRGAVIIMVGAPDKTDERGSHDSYYVNWAGPCLTAKGLREQGNEVLQGLIRFTSLKDDASQAKVKDAETPEANAQQLVASFLLQDGVVDMKNNKKEAEASGYWIYSGERRGVVVKAATQEEALEKVQKSPEYDGFGTVVYRVEEFAKACTEDGCRP